MSAPALRLEEQWDFLRQWTNEPDPTVEPRFIEGDSREIMQLFPDDSIDFEFTSPPYPRPRKPEDLGRYRRFIGDDGSLLPEASAVPHCRQQTKKLIRQQNLRAAGRSPHVNKKLHREGFKHGKPNLKGETGLAVQLHPDEWWDWFRPFAREMLRILKPRRALLLNLGGVVCPTWNHHTYDWDLPSRMKSIGWQFIRPIYWDKPNGPPTTAEGSMTNVVEHIFWFAKGTSPDVGPEWFPWELHQTKTGTETKRPIVRNVVRFPVGQTRWPVRCPRCSRVSARPTGNRQAWLCRYCGEETARGEWWVSTHFACFPLAMAEWAIRGWSEPPTFTGGMFDGDDATPGLVLDPFIGSGTTAIAATKLGRRWIGIDLSPEGELDCARERWAMEFGKA